MEGKYPLYLKATILLALIFLIVAFLYLARPFLVPFTVAALLAFLLYPISKRLEKWRVPRALAIIISLLIALIIIAGLVFFLSSQVMSFKDDLPQLKESIGQKLQEVQGFIERTINMNEKRQLEIFRERSQMLLESSGTHLLNIFSATGSFIAMVGLMPIYIFFFTFYREKFVNFLLWKTKSSRHSKVKDIIERLSKVTQKYLTGLIIDIAILSVLNSIGFLILGLKHALLLAVVAAILNIIPYVGVLIGSIFPILMALLTKDSMWYAVGALGVCVVVQFLDNNFITPKVVGSSVSVNPLATLVALIIGGLIWGVAGMMLFIPLLGMIKVILDNIENLKPYGYLIGNTDYEEVEAVTQIETSEE